MAKFQWEGTTRTGETRQGVMDAANEDSIQSL